MCSNSDPFNLIEADLITAAIVELETSKNLAV